MLFFAGTFSQEKQIQGVVVDSKTSYPLPFVNISKSVGHQGTSSDESGKFNISISTNDSLFFSAVGYMRRYVSAAKITNSNGIVKLDEDVQLLSEIVVKSKRKVKSEALVLGYHKSKKRSSFIMRNSGSQVAVFLENTSKKEGVFETLYLKLKSIDNFKFQVRVFEKNPNGLPGRDLLRENFIVELNRFDGVFSINLATKNIIFPTNGAFICLQSIENQNRKLSDGSKLIGENATFLSSGDKESNTYNGFRDRYWVRERTPSPSGNYGNSNVMFGAKVRFFELEP